MTEPRFFIDQFRIDKMSELGVPDYMHGALIRWIEHGVDGGDFLMAVLRNDLRSAVDHADDYNRHAIANYVIWLFNYAPMGSWGSEDAVRSWPAVLEQMDLQRLRNEYKEHRHEPTE